MNTPLAWLTALVYALGFLAFLQGAIKTTAAPWPKALLWAAAWPMLVATHLLTGGWWPRAVTVAAIGLCLFVAPAHADPIYCYASYYWEGQKTANGENYKPDGVTCAHKTIRFGTLLKVTNIRNGRSTTCRVNDRGPYIAKRCIDLSRGAARAVGMLEAGVVPVQIEVLR